MAIKNLISRRSFMQASGLAAAGAAVSASMPAASACVPLFGEKEDVVILHTNDVHTYIDKKSPQLTYAAIAALKRSCADAGENVLLVDAGDHVQGTAYGAMDDGASIIQLMNAAGYDLAVPGNHEFDYGMARFKAIINEAEFPYISCNWLSTDGLTVRVLPDIKLFCVGGMRIAFVGVTTPETLTKTTPAYFMDAGKSRYIYDFCNGSDGKQLYDAVQYSINKAKLIADYVIGLGHLGVDPFSAPWTSSEVIANTTGFDAFIDGHSHTVVNEYVQDAAGNSVLLVQTGSHFENVGKLTIHKDGSMTEELLPTYEGVDSAVAAQQQQWIDDVDDMLGEKIAVAESPMYIKDPVTGAYLVRLQGCSIGDFVADGIYAYFNEIEQIDCDIAIMNGGGIRANVPAGYWTFKTCKEITPFGNVICLMSVTGQQVQDALEFGARYVGTGYASGSFLHVAGIKFEVHSDIPDTVPVDANGTWQGSPAGTPRVQNVRVYNRAVGAYEPLDPARTYSLASINYIVRECGSGFEMFKNAELIKDFVSEDYLVTASYAMMFGGTDEEGLAHITSANSPLAAYPNYLINYEDINGSGRITII